MSECHRDGEGDHSPGMPLRATETALRATQGPKWYPKSVAVLVGALTPIIDQEDEK